MPGHGLDSMNELKKKWRIDVMSRTLSRQWLIGLVGLGALLFRTTATAATDGVLGLTSTGTTDISIIKGDTDQITGLQDIIMVPWTAGDPAPAGTSPACVYTSTGNYQMTATVQVNISVAQITGAPTGNYGDTLTVLIAPQ